MKNYDETINAVFDRIGEYESAKKQKRKMVTRTITPLCCFCLAALLGIGVWKSGIFMSHSPDVDVILDGTFEHSNPNQQVSDKESDKTSDKNSTENNGAVINPNVLVPWDDPTVIWGDAEQDVDEGFSEWNNMRISSGLYEALKKAANENRVVAVSVSFKIDDQFVYNGKTLSDYFLEADYERNLPEKLRTLLKCGDELKYGDELYKTGTPDGVKWAKEFYDMTVECYGEEFLAKYIVNGEFLREKAESDALAAEGENKADLAYEAARDAYYGHIIEETVKHLNVPYEHRTNPNRLIIFVTDNELASLWLDNVWCFGLAMRGSGDQILDIDE